MPTDRGGEPKASATIETDDASWPKRVAKKVKLDVLVSPGPFAVLAIHHPGLLRMQLQPTITKPGVQLLSQAVCLGFALAMHDAVVSIAAKRNAWMVR